MRGLKKETMINLVAYLFGLLYRFANKISGYIDYSEYWAAGFLSFVVFEVSRFKIKLIAYFFFGYYINASDSLKYLAIAFYFVIIFFFVFRNRYKYFLVKYEKLSKPQIFIGQIVLIYMIIMFLSSLFIAPILFVLPN
jgi:hypothetical protein